MAAPEGGTGYSIRAVQRVCDILDLIQENPRGFSLAQVAERADFPKSSAFRYLATLEERRYVRREPTTGTFQIGSAFLTLQSQRLQVLCDRARPYMQALVDEFGETVNLGVLDGNTVSYVEIAESPKSVRLAARVGDRDPLHSTALGKAIASALPSERVKAILTAEGMPARTKNTIIDLDAYMDELVSVRRRGYAVDERENEDEGRCVAVSIAGVGLPASISIAAPESRFRASQVPRAGKALIKIAAELVGEHARSNGREDVTRIHGATV